ncbi:MAG: hypothetical protein ACRDV9_12445 [Acidimicrobiia bacterium]
MTFDFQVMVWGHAVLGEIAEPNALLVEQEWPPSTHLWDLTYEDLEYTAIDRGNGWEKPPYWYALRQLPWSMREEAC